MKKSLCFLIMLGAWVTVAAQDVMAQINKIKLKGGHLTAQYSHESVDSAYMMGARDILHQLILEGYGVFTMDEIHSRIRHLDMPRGNVTRVFSYLDLAGITKKTNSNATINETVKIKPKFEVKEEINVQPQLHNVTDDDPQTRMARDIMAQKDIAAAMNILKAKKNAGLILGYGPFAKGTNIDEVYIAIFDRTTSVPMAVLSPTTDGKRSNLITKADDTLSNYHGCKAIWISF